MRTQQQTAATVIDWLREGRRVAAGLLASVDGSAPLDVGASVYIDEGGSVEGSITGGCVESAVAQEALEIIETGGAPKLITYGISDELAGTVGLMCGGIVHVFVHELRGDARDVTIAALRGGARGAAGRRRDAAGRRARGRASCSSTASVTSARSAARRCWRRTSSARPAASSSRGARPSARSARTARRWAPACASTSPPTPSGPAWSSSARSTSRPRSRRWPRASATASRSPTRARRSCPRRASRRTPTRSRRGPTRRWRA